MGRVKELSAIADEIRDCGQKMLDIADSLTALFSGDQADTAPAPAKKKTASEAPTLEQVRAALAQKSADGFTDQVRALLQKHGADKLSAVNPANYAALLADASRIGRTEAQP